MSDCNYEYLAGETAATGRGTSVEVITVVQEAPGVPSLIIAKTTNGYLRAYCPFSGFDLSGSHSPSLRPRPDVAQIALEKWETLDVDLRTVLLEAGKTKKIMAIKCAQDGAGMSHAEAKYAIENFDR